MPIMLIMNIRNLSPLELKEKVSLLYHTSIQLYSEELGELLTKQNADNNNETLDDIFSEKDIRDFPWYQEYLFALRKMRMFHTKYCSLVEWEGVLLVTKKECNVFWDDKKKDTWEVFETYMYYKWSPNVRLHTPKDLDIKTLEVMVESGMWYKYFSLPDVFVKRLISYLELYKNDDVHDCNHFERHMLRVADRTTYHEIVRLDERDWSYENINIWDAIALYMKTSIKPIHKAIYLWNELFISKLGKNILGVTTLQQLHQIYETDEVALKRLFWDSNAYKKQKEETAEILKNHPDRERLEKMYESIRKYGIS